MGTTSDKLLYLQGTKSAIKDAIVAKGVSVETGTHFRDYATKIGEISGGGGTLPPVADAWVRPTEWLALPDNVDGVQKVSILNAVFDTDSEFVAFTCQGAYTVDWGDGVIENFLDGVKAYHKYEYSNVNLNSDTVVEFGYKQCIITITPLPGQNLSYIYLNTDHPTVGPSDSYDLVSGFLDMRINSLSCTLLAIGSTGIGANIDFVKHTMLEQCLIGELRVTSLSYLFADCYALQSVSIKDTSNIILFYGMHFNNYSLQKMPNYTFRSAGVQVNDMFNNCYSLVETYPINVTITGSTVFSMFSSCKSLKYIDLTINSNVNYSLASLFYQCSTLNTIKLTLTGTGKVTSLSNTFVYTAIKESPVIDTSLCASFANTFQSCNRLVNLYEYNYTSATTLSNMLTGCYSLKDAGYFNTTSVLTQVGSMCNNCFSLEKAPEFANSSGVNSASSMFNGCHSLKTIPSYVFGSIAASGIDNFLINCKSLQVMSAISIGNIYTSNGSILTNCYSLKRMLMPLRFTFSVLNAKMSTGALNEMYSILPTVTSQTVTVTGNYGATSTPVVSLSGTATAGSKTITMTNTTNLSVGMFVSGTGTTLTTGNSCVFTDSGDLVTAAGHGLIDGDIVSLKTITGTTGIGIKIIYYVVNATTDTFQLSLTQGGSVIDLVTDGTGTYTSPAFITAITPNVSIEVSLPMVSTGTSSRAFRSNDHKTYLATMKGWTVTG